MRCGSAARPWQACLPPGFYAESAGCEALCASRPVDEIRSALLPGAKRPATTVSKNPFPEKYLRTEYDSLIKIIFCKNKTVCKKKNKNPVRKWFKGLYGLHLSLSMLLLWSNSSHSYISFLYYGLYSITSIGYLP